MNRYICMVCGYVHEGEAAPESCPQCNAQQAKFKKMQQESINLPDEHRIGVAEGVDNDIVEALRQDFATECTEVGVYIAMSRQADREGYPEIAEVLRRIAFEEADHAAKYAELLGELVSVDTRRNLQSRADNEYNICDSKKRLATKTKQLNLDAIHDMVHEMCKDEARHCAMLRGMLERYFGR